MGQAFDSAGNVVAEAFGQTKKEVFDKLIGQAPDAAEVRITLLQNKIEEIQRRPVIMNQAEDAGPIGHDDAAEGDLGASMVGTLRKATLTGERRRELVSLAERIATELEGKLKPSEYCFFRRAVELFVEK